MTRPKPKPRAVKTWAVVTTGGNIAIFDGRPAIYFTAMDAEYNRLLRMGYATAPVFVTRQRKARKK